MKNISKSVVAIGATLALTLTGCAANEGSAPASSATTASAKGSGLSGTLAGKGATSAKAAEETWIANFQTANPGVTVNYAPEGSGAGREGFISGAVDFAGSDRALKDSEMGKGKFAKCTSDSNAINLPIFISPIGLAFNIDGVKQLKLDADTAAKIFRGEITKWNDPAITALNPGEKFPDANITAVHRSDDSGTTFNFTDWLAKAAPGVWPDKAAGIWPASLKGEAAKGTSGVINVVKNSKNAIGYAEEAQAKALGLALAEIKVGDQFFGPTPEAAAKIVDAAKRVPGRSADDYALELDRTAKGAYPIALVSYAIVCEHYKDPKAAELVKAYLGYVVSDAGQQAAAKAAGSAPLSAEYQQKLAAVIKNIK